MNYDGNGKIRIKTYTADEALPVSDTLIKIYGTDDYNKLKEDTLPQINSVTLKGNKVSSELHVQHEMDVISYQDIDDILFG